MLALRRIAPVILVLSIVVAGMAQANKQFSAKAQQRITKEVRHQILSLPDFDTFDNIAFKLNGYDVILFGQVVQPTLKSDAEKVVRKIEAWSTSITGSKCCRPQAMTTACVAICSSQFTVMLRCSITA